MQSISLHQRGSSENRCAWCHDLIEQGFICEGCGARLHVNPECLSRGCTTPGCANTATESSHAKSDQAELAATQKSLLDEIGENIDTQTMSFTGMNKRQHNKALFIFNCLFAIASAYWMMSEPLSKFTVIYGIFVLAGICGAIASQREWQKALTEESPND